MTLTRARILKASPGVGTPPIDAVPRLSPERARRIVAVEAAARDAAAELLARARQEAQAIVAEARSGAEAATTAAAAEARASEEARLASAFLRLKVQDERRAGRDLDRAVALAVVLAERLLGAALERDPAHIVRLAQQALAEARGARRAAIDASPLDAEVLRQHLGSAGFEGHHLEVREDPSMSRGSLRITTDLGTLDAPLQPQLERLAAALRESLGQK